MGCPMDMRLTIVVAAVGMACACADASPAQAATQDSVDGVGELQFADVEVHARSGPSGENATGQVEIRFRDTSVSIAGPVTCLAVSTVTQPTGDADVSAVVNFVSDDGSVWTFQLTRTPSAAVNSFLVERTNRSPTDCSRLPGFFGSDGSSYIVVDAQPLPTSKDRCKNGGWKTFGVFKNQGDCVSFVATGGKNPPANKPR